MITELGVFDTAGDCFICVVRADGVTQQTIEHATGARVLFTTVHRQAAALPPSGYPPQPGLLPSPRAAGRGLG